jgi:hypothetical protein
MRELIQKTISLLKQRVKNNLELINQNQVKIKEILQEPSSSNRSVRFEQHYEINKSLLAENNDFINIQLVLINFLEKYKDSQVFNDNLPVIEIKKIKSEDELFNLTLKGTLPYNEGHPLYNNKAFFMKLLKHYQDIEAYEKCQELINLKKPQKHRD